MGALLLVVLGSAPTGPAAPTPPAGCAEAFALGSCCGLSFWGFAASSPDLGAALGFTGLSTTGLAAAGLDFLGLRLLAFAAFAAFHTADVIVSKNDAIIY